MPRKKTPYRIYFWTKANKGVGDECWSWSGKRHEYGYGMTWISERRVWDLAHRVSWEMHNGPIPDGLFVLHHCDNPPCSRPDHLFLGTQKDNIHDAMRKGRTSPPPRNDLRGMKSGTARMTDEGIRDLRAMWETGLYKQKHLGDLFGLDQPQVSAIVNRKTWKHILPDPPLQRHSTV